MFANENYFVREFFMFKKMLPIKIKSFLFITIIFFGFFALPQVIYSQEKNKKPVGYTCKITFTTVGATVDFIQKVAQGNIARDNIKDAYLSGNNTFKTVYSIFPEDKESGLKLGEGVVFYRFGESINIDSIWNLYTSKRFAKRAYEQLDRKSIFLNEEDFFTRYEPNGNFEVVGGPIPISRNKSNAYEDIAKKIVSQINQLKKADIKVTRENKCSDGVYTIFPRMKIGAYIFTIKISTGKLIYPSDLKKDEEETEDEPQPAENVSLNPSRLDKIGAGSGKSAVQDVIGRIIKVVLQIIGTLALIMFIYGGLLIMGSEGKSDRYYKGMKTMLWAALGTITILASYALVDFVLQAF